MKDVMLDLETWGKGPGCAIRSIGAAFFNPRTGEVGKTFYQNIDQVSCEQAGLHIDPETALWWEKQSQASKDALEANPMSLLFAMAEFDEFWKEYGGERVWCQGAAFDAPIWEAAAKALNRTVPWKYWNVRCTRTAYDILGIWPKEIARTGTHHNALDDCLHQIKCLDAGFTKGVGGI